MTLPAAALCRHCSNPIDEVVVYVDFSPVLTELAAIRRALHQLGVQMTDINDEVNAQLDDLTGKVAAVDTDLARELADFAATVAPKLTDEEKARFAALSQKLVDFTTEIDAADAPPAPAPAPAEPTPAPEQPAP